MPRPETTFAILAYDGIEPIDIGATYGVLSMARRLAPDLRFFVVSRSGGELVMANGLRLVADRSFTDCPDADVLMVLGGPGWQDASERSETTAFIAKFHRREGTVAARLHRRHDRGGCRTACGTSRNNQARNRRRRDASAGFAGASVTPMSTRWRRGSSIPARS